MRDGGHLLAESTPSGDATMLRGRSAGYDSESAITHCVSDSMSCMISAPRLPREKDFKGSTTTAELAL
jgi:hypothetical protein